jgi:hypothetical protein
MTAGEGRCLDVRHTTSSAFKRIKVWQAAKSRRHSREPHDLSAAWAKRTRRSTSLSTEFDRRAGHVVRLMPPGLFNLSITQNQR